MRRLAAAIGIILYANATPSQAAETRATPEMRAEYAERLRRVFLANGVSTNVFALEKRAGTSFDPLGRYPRLVFLGYLNDSSVYQAVTAGKVLEGAKEIGFAGVEFASKGRAAFWRYDLTGQTLPSCDITQRLCH